MIENVTQVHWGVLVKKYRMKMIVKQSKKDMRKMLQGAISWINITEKKKSLLIMRKSLWMCLPCSNVKESALCPISVQKCHQVYYFVLYSGRHCNCIIKDVQFFSLHKRPYPIPDSFSELPSKLWIAVNTVSYSMLRKFKLYWNLWQEG